MNKIDKIELNIKELAVDKFLKLNPKIQPSEMRNGIITMEIELLRNKSFLNITLSKTSATFEINQTTSEIFNSKSCAFNFTKYYGSLTRRNKDIRKKAEEFFDYKYKELLNCWDIKSTRKLKLKGIK